VLGVLPGIIATIQATEAVKWLTGIGEPLVGRLLLYDALDLSFREFRIQKDPECPVCGVAPSITELIDYEVFCGVEVSDAVRRVSPVELAARRSGGEAGLLLDVREPEEIAKASIEGAVAIPLGELAARLAELAGYREQSVVVHCHRGGRSETAVRLLENAGFSRVESLDGGIEAWSLTLDPAVPRY
jgi:adenylyltransferase/sulfurtransferase